MPYAVIIISYAVIRKRFWLDSFKMSIETGAAEQIHCHEWNLYGPLGP